MSWPAEAQTALFCRVTDRSSGRSVFWRPCVLLVTVVMLLVLCPGWSRADDWRASLYDEGLPSHLVAVDKQRQTFLFFEKKSPFKLKYSYPCVTGQLAGDKQERNDLRTPEGIYFVEYKIASGLDFEEYGGIAYTLNYPNPVDRLRGKTGHGIWIHSKGYGLVPTRGCVAIGLKDIDQVGPQLIPGTAVVLAQHLNDEPVLNPDDGTVRRLRYLMHAWSDAWASRSPRLFEYYDPAAYSKGTEDFDAFRRNKERLFKILDFIKIYNREIHVLQGPGYWVTWAEQFYTASNLSTEGVRRLYWQKGRDDEFRIVGMEWTPRDLGMKAAFQKGTLVAWIAPPVATDAGSEIPRAPRLDMPEHPASKIIADPAAASQQGKGQAVALNEPLVPAPMPVPQPAEIDWGQGQSMEDRPQHAPSASVSAVPKVVDALQEQVKTKKTILQLDDKLRSILGRTVQRWNAAYAARDASILDFYDSEQFGRLPETSHDASWKETRLELVRQFRAPWLKLVSLPAELRLEGDLVVSECPLMVVTANTVREGLQSLWWQKKEDGTFRIVASHFVEGSYDLAALYLDEISIAVSADLEAWRKAWEGGRLEAYLAFYTENAIQQGRSGKHNIRHQKRGLWSRVKPVMVQLSGLRLSMEKQGIRADMHQDYADSAGRSDRGIKTLWLRFDGRSWRIHREDWTAQDFAPAPPPEETR